MNAADFTAAIDWLEDMKPHGQNTYLVPREGMDKLVAELRTLRDLAEQDEPVPGHQEPARGTSAGSAFRPWDEKVLEAMAVWGGGFVKQLRLAYLRADSDNRRRILEVWDPLYGPQYREQAKRLRQREQDDEETLAVPAGGAR